MKPRPIAGYDRSDEFKILQREINRLKDVLSERGDAEATALLGEKELSVSVTALQGGRFESNRRKF